MDRVPNEALLAAGLDLMKAAAMPLQRLPNTGRAMIYQMADGKKVRVRTCNDHILVALADGTGEGAQLNIQGTDYLLIVMPTIPRNFGPVVAYLVPTEIAEKAVRSTHKAWLASNPNTKGDNRTWNLWFDDNGPAKANGFARKWSEYRLLGEATTQPASHLDPSPSETGVKLGDVIARAKQQIAEAAGISPNSVKITLDLA